MAGKLHLTYPPNVSKVTAQRRRAQIRGLGLYHLPFVFLYFFSLRSCVETSGVPYQTALAHHKSKGYDPDAFTAKAADVKKPKVVDDWGGAAVEDDPWADLDADEGEDDASASASAAASAAASTVFVDENGTIVNATTADAEEQITYETPPTLPAAWLPEFYAVAVFSVIATTHVLLCFAQHWSVKFRAFMNYRETDAIKDGSYLMFVPMPHQGKAEIVRVNALEIPDADAPGGVREMLWTTFQRQRFEFVETERGGGANGKARGEVREVLTPVANALSSYVRPTRGLTPAAVAAYVSRYGDNSLRVPLPTFMQVYKEQLMGPVTVFQVFTVLLWLMDEYWKYAIFSAASLLLFEGTTAFSKIKNIRTLRGMGQAPGRVNCLRDGRWEDRNTEDLVPGDIVSIVRVAGGAESPIPCDCLVLRGSAVVNEASLTGESVPQMKDALSPEAIASDPSKPLDIDGEHKVNVLYSGTTLMQQSTGEQPTGGVAANLPKTPDGGCLCYVLQTWFSSTQWKLMRMMEFSSEQVTGDTWETLVLLFILLVFACVASGHVFVVGLRDGKRSQYELVLRCILILTSVVPPELPMQTAMAVNTALLALMKAAVFCTEPFRVPISGKVDTCLFDKTWTLTSDQLVAVGVVTPVSGAGAGGEDGEYSELTPCAEASKAASLVVAGCHSLVQVDGKTFGDPLEQAALRGVKWRFDPRSQTAVPTEHMKDPARDEAMKAAKLPPPKPPTRSWTGRPMVKILVRNHFSSALQRMSAVANVVQNSNDAPAAWVLMKGSPEIVATLLTKKPAGYDLAYRKLAEQGYRIIALAHRVLSTDEAHRVKDPRCPLTRDEMERGLTFDGFLAFACPVRTDTPDVVKALKASSHTVMMATGDSAMTALHVANEVHIASGGLERALTLVASGGGGAGDDGDGAAPTLRWVSAKTDDATNEPIREIPYAADGSIPALAKDYCLCVTGAALNAAAVADGFSVGGDGGDAAKDVKGVGRGNGGLWDYLDSVVVFARMSPDDKERVLKRLKQQGRHTFMCGDGANDVGALKQAHVGVALLSGFGSANTKKVDAAGADAGAVATTNKSEVPTEAKAETFSEKMKRVQEQAAKMKEAKKKEAIARKKDQVELQALQKQWFDEEVNRRTAAGEQWAAFSAMKAATQRMIAETKRRAEIRRRENGGPMGAPGFAQMMAEMEGAEDMETPKVKLGDASMAAPFTSRIPSVRSAVDIIRQGRCTLVSAIQMQQVLVLSCLISAYSLSVLYLDGIRSSDNQMIASGSALTAASLAFSYATPVHTLSPVRPLRSIFHPANFLSLIGQLVIHIGCMVYAVEMVRRATGEEALFPENAPIAIVSDALKANATEEQRSIWEQGPPFKPSLLNTVVFLVETVQRVCVMLVNYKGRPFMMGAIENKTLLTSLASMVAGAFICAFEVLPWLNTWLKLVPLPSFDFRVRILAVLGVSVGGTIAWDQLMLLCFAPQILFAAYRDTYRALPAPRDLVKPWKRAIAMGVAGYLYFTTGNVFVLLGLFYAMKNKVI